uniref:hypothetical protein n=1 Tax=Gracilariopsis tenuifrons TaxID=31472 RepID=UPI001D113722|nr:hypothetical protein LK036_pgp005 [Gracilariopsis tenuifrons]UAD89360.1 hypothetical protein [Gracilariopsis tenuifrons]
MNLLISSVIGRTLGLAANNAIKSLGTALIVFSTTRMGKGFVIRISNHEIIRLRDACDN